MSGRGRKYNEEDDERWDETDTAQRRRQFFEGQPRSTALTRGPSTRSRQRDSNDPYTEPLTGLDDRRRSSQSGYAPGSSARPRSRSRVRRDDDRYGGPSKGPSSYDDIERRRREDRERSPPPISMVTRPGDSARRDRSLSRTRYDEERESKDHDDKVARDRALARRIRRESEEETRLMRARQAETTRRSSRYDDHSREDPRRSEYEVDRRGPDRDPNRKTRLTSQERRDRRVGFDPVEDVRHISDDSGTDHSKEDKSRKRSR